MIKIGRIHIHKDFVSSLIIRWGQAPPPSEILWGGASGPPGFYFTDIVTCTAVLFKVKRLIAATTLVCCIELHAVVSTSTQLPSL